VGDGNFSRGGQLWLFPGCGQKHLSTEGVIGKYHIYKSKGANAPLHTPSDVHEHCQCRCFNYLNDIDLRHATHVIVYSFYTLVARWCVRRRS